MGHGVRLRVIQQLVLLLLISGFVWNLVGNLDVVEPCWREVLLYSQVKFEFARWFVVGLLETVRATTS